MKCFLSSNIRAKEYVVWSSTGKGWLIVDTSSSSKTSLYRYNPTSLSSHMYILIPCLRNNYMTIVLVFK